MYLAYQNTFIHLMSALLENSLPSFEPNYKNAKKIYTYIYIYIYVYINFTCKSALHVNNNNGVLPYRY